MQFGFLRKKTTRSARLDRSRRPLKRRRLSIDHLEDRRLLSLATPGTGFTVDPTSGSSSWNGAPRSVAMDSTGDAVVGWAVPDANGDGNTTLNFQLYTNNAGTMKPAAAGQVATGVLSTAANGGHVIDPVLKVARAPSGNFVTLWDTSYLDSLGVAHYTTYARLYSPSGAALTGAIQVGGNGNDLPESVAMNDNGFDVLYGAIASNRKSSTGAITLTVQRYHDSGSTVGKPISVATPSYIYLNGGADSMAMDGNGNFVVVWNDTNSSGQYVIRAQRYNGSGQAQGGVIQVNPSPTPYFQNESNVAMDPATGDFVVAWQEWAQAPKGGSEVADLFARQFASDGTPASQGVITVAQGTYTLDSSYPSGYSAASGGALYGPIGVAALHGRAGAFDVTWTHYTDTYQPNGSGGYTSTITHDINVSTYNASGVLGQSLQTTTNGNGNGAPSADVDANNDLIVVWTSPSGVLAEFYLDPPAAADGAMGVSAAAFLPASGRPHGGPTTAVPWKVAPSELTPRDAFASLFVDKEALDALVRAHAARGWK